MLNIYQDLNEKEGQILKEMRTWALSQGDPSEHLIGKLAIIQRVIDSGRLGRNDLWKMNALGVLFGDALEHAMEGRLSWVVTEDESGAAFALSWKHSDVLVYPLSAIRSRLQAGEPVDVHALYAEYASIFPFRTL